ncbi:MAG: DUF748 domain-containing protein [Chromatiales bacterium]|nr:DUF748 domain-containing protein [Chromatiales bacterium]
MPVSDGRSRWLRHSAWLVIAAGAWSAFGFLLLPWLLTRELPPRLGAVLGVPVSVEQVRINPWLLTATIEGLQLDAGDGAPLILAARIHVNPKLFRSLWHRAVVLGELQLETPFVRLRREPDGRIELLELAATGNGSEAETAGEASLPGIVIDELILDAGIIAIEDRVPATPFQARIEPVSIRLSGISTLPDVEGGQQVMLSAAGGLRLGWSGTLQLNPFQSAGTISASGPWLASRQST